MNNTIPDDSLALKRYHDTIRRVILTQFPSLTIDDVDEVIRYNVAKRYVAENATIDNNYNNKKINLTLVELTDYIIKREPIITAWGVMWKNKGEVPNPLAKMIKGFMESRGLLKKEMFK